MFSTNQNPATRRRELLFRVLNAWSTRISRAALLQWVRFAQARTRAKLLQALAEARLRIQVWVLFVRSLLLVFVGISAASDIPFICWRSIPPHFVFAA